LFRILYLKSIDVRTKRTFLLMKTRSNALGHEQTNQMKQTFDRRTMFNEGDVEDDTSFYIQKNETLQLKTVSGYNKHANVAEQKTSTNREPFGNFSFCSKNFS